MRGGRWFVIWLHLALNTGARKGEILGLTWDDIDVENREITFRGIETKNRQTRRVPISDPLLEMLEKHHEDADERDGPVFPVRSHRKPWAKLQQMAKLPHVTPHTLRHHVASTMVLRGVALTIVRDLLGHKNISVTSRYLKVRTEDKMKALNLLGDADADEVDDPQEAEGAQAAEA
jgi:integrase